MIFHQYNDYHNKQKSVNSSFEVLRFGSTFSLVYPLGSRHAPTSKKCRKKKLILTAFSFPSGYFNFDRMGFVFVENTLVPLLFLHGQFS